MTKKEYKEYTTIRMWKGTHRKHKLKAVRAGKTLLEYFDSLA